MSDAHRSPVSPPPPRDSLAPKEVPPALKALRTTLDRQDAWRSTTLNLIASENVLSPAARLVLDSDLVHRYAEGHPGARYYEGTRFVDVIEADASAACRRVFRCGWADVRPISGTVSNEAVFSRLVPRGATVIAHKVATGGHISHDRMGALGKRTDRILPWPTLEDGYRIDVSAAKDLLLAEKPVVAVLGRSLFLFPEPVAELAEAARAAGTRLLYDGAHVLGLIAGGSFQDPLREGADVLMGSTHKTYFGPQRGVVLDAGRRRGPARRRRQGRLPRQLEQPPSPLAAVAPRGHPRDGGLRRRVREGRRAQRAGARRRARRVAASPWRAPTSASRESHQVVLDVGASGGGREVAARLSQDDVITNMNLLPGEPGKSAMNPRGIRMGVQELTRFGMGVVEMEEVARLLDEAIVHRKAVAPDVHRLRARFPTIRYGFEAHDFARCSGRARPAPTARDRRTRSTRGGDEVRAPSGCRHAPDRG